MWPHSSYSSTGVFVRPLFDEIFCKDSYFLSDIKSLENTNEVLLELSWHGNSSVYFKYFTDGASQAIKSLKSKCGLK